MKDEIKEILDDLDNKECYINNETILTFDEAKQLLDYTTNLQKEYETELDENYKLSEWLVQKQKRIDKAKEYIKKEIADIEWMKKEYSDYNRIGEVEVELKSIEKLNDILNGDDK